MSSKFQAFKEYYGLKQCIRCGTNTEEVNHHYYCNKCWKYNQLDKMTKDLNAIMKGMKK